MFGGATGDTGRYVITGDTYALDIIGNKWSKLDGTYLLILNLCIILQSSSFAIGSGIAPSPRAAHGSCSVDSLQMVVYGGATGGGSLASDDLYLLDLRNGD